MNLPELPKKLNKREAAFGTVFRRWIAKNPRNTALFELKQTPTYMFRFSLVPDHQLNALIAAKRPVGILYKIPDDSRSVKPCDMFYMRNAEAYIVIKYPEWFFGIDIDEFINEKNNSRKKSLSRERAAELSTFRQGY